MAKMTMIAQFLVAAVAVGLTMANEPPAYKQSLAAIRDATDTIVTNVVSMEGDVPLLNDSRRHYAEIVNVINHHAYMRSKEKPDSASPYYEVYYPYLDVSAPEAISNPEKVISAFSHLHDVVHNRTNELIELIDSCVLDTNDCNALIDDAVKENYHKYGKKAAVLLSAGNAALIFNYLNYEFETASKNLMGHHFVTSVPEELEALVYAVTDVYYSLHRIHNQK